MDAFDKNTRYFRWGSKWPFQSTPSAFIPNLTTSKMGHHHSYGTSRVHRTTKASTAIVMSGGGCSTGNEVFHCGHNRFIIYCSLLHPLLSYQKLTMSWYDKGLVFLRICKLYPIKSTPKIKILNKPTLG